MFEGGRMDKLDANDGIYLAYFTAEYGTSIGMFTFLGGIVCGADLGGGIYDGALEYSDKSKELVGNIIFKMKEGGVTITGASSDLPVSYSTSVKFLVPVDSIDFHQIETLTGLVNVRFEKVRSL